MKEELFVKIVTASAAIGTAVGPFPDMAAVEAHLNRMPPGDYDIYQGTPLKRLRVPERTFESVPRDA